MAKHCTFTFTDITFTYECNEKIDPREADLDGIYAIRTNVEYPVV